MIFWNSVFHLDFHAMVHNMAKCFENALFTIHMNFHSSSLYLRIASQVSWGSLLKTRSWCRGEELCTYVKSCDLPRSLRIINDHIKATWLALQSFKKYSYFSFDPQEISVVPTENISTIHISQSLSLSATVKCKLFRVDTWLCFDANKRCLILILYLHRITQP